MTVFVRHPLPDGCVRGRRDSAHASVPCCDSGRESRCSDLIRNLNRPLSHRNNLKHRLICDAATHLLSLRTAKSTLPPWHEDRRHGWERPRPARATARTVIARGASPEWLGAGMGREAPPMGRPRAWDAAGRSVAGCRIASEGQDWPLLPAPGTADTRNQSCRGPL